MRGKWFQNKTEHIQFQNVNSPHSNNESKLEFISQKQNTEQNNQSQYFSEEKVGHQNKFHLKLYHNLKELNKNLEEKEEEIILIKKQLQTLENNINAQVDEFLRSMVATDMNFENMLLESQRGNQVDHLIDNLCLKMLKNYIFENNHKINLSFYREMKKI